MFRIEAFCDDKNLPRVLYALMGLVHGQPAIQPVANAKVTKGEVRAKSNGQLLEIFAEHLKTNKITTVRPADVKAFSVKHGYSEASSNYFIQQWVKAKLLKRKPGTKGSSSTYLVVR
jgi:hypothetical protein